MEPLVELAAAAMVGMMMEVKAGVRPLGGPPGFSLVIPPLSAAFSALASPPSTPAVESTSESSLVVSSVEGATLPVLWLLLLLVRLPAPIVVYVGDEADFAGGGAWERTS